MSEANDKKGKLHRHGLEIHAHSPTIHYCVCNVNENLLTGASEEWADLIVRACNSYYELLEALKPFADLDMGTAVYADYKTRFDILHKYIIDARAAIAKALGK